MKMNLNFNKTVIITLTLLLAISLTFGCKKKEDTTEIIQTTTVQRGTLTVTVSASGNLALAKTEDLAFDVSGYVYRVLVEEGDSVTEGQLVADIDDFDWQKEKRTLEMAVLKAKASLNDAIRTLEDTQNPTTTTSAISGSIAAPDPLEVESKELLVEQAKISVESAEKELERYLETSSQVLATFDGFVTNVYVSGGDEIYKGALAVTIADPNKFKTDVLINELDIDKVEIGMTATIEVGSLTTSGAFPAKVTAIAPTATNESGVINYTVEVELLSQEEAEEYFASQAEQFIPPQGMQMPSGEMPAGKPPSGEMPSGEMPASAPQATGTAQLDWDGLRDGLSVTVTITSEEKADVLMVPIRAVTTQGFDSVVRVMKGDEYEYKVVVTGISNSSYIEITAGLSEGEEIASSAKTTTITTTTSQSNGPGAFGMMGGGPPR